MNNQHFTKKKLSRIVFHVALFTLFLLTIGTNVSSIAKPLANHHMIEAQSTPWLLSQAQSYLTAKPAVSEPVSLGMQYTKSLSNCDSSLLNLSVYSTRYELDEFLGQDLIFRVRMNEHDAIIKVPASFIETNNHSITLRPFLVNHQLQSDLLTHEQIKLELLAPEGLVELVDEPTLMLGLTGLQETHQQMMEFCAVMAERNESTTHYALQHDVL